VAKLSHRIEVFYGLSGSEWVEGHGKERTVQAIHRHPSLTQQRQVHNAFTGVFLIFCLVIVL